jgi:fucose 4-O-acetylase-like acetyltransferase
MPLRTFSGVVAALLLFTIFFEPWQGPSDWEARISSASTTEWISHLVMTGLYPFIPWAIFAALGMTVGSLREEHARIALFRRISCIGLIVSLMVLFDTWRNQRAWALPTGEASLTFFPANAAFIVAALTGTALLWWIAERTGVFALLSELGRVSLTVYVFHFLPMTFFRSVDEVNNWPSTLTALLVIGYTVGWMVLGTWLHRRLPHFTLEALMKRWEPN